MMSILKKMRRKFFPTVEEIIADRKEREIAAMEQYRKESVAHLIKDGVYTGYQKFIKSGEVEKAAFLRAEVKRLYGVDVANDYAQG